MSDAPALLQCCFMTSGTYRDKETQTTMQQRIFDLGGTVSPKLTPSVTHLLCNDAEFAKRSAKVKAVLAQNQKEDVPRVWIIDQSWLDETTENGERPLEEEWDLELNQDQDDAEFDEQERQERQKQADERKRARELQKQEEEDGKRKETEESAPQQSQQAQDGKVPVDQHCELAGKTHVHSSGSLPWHALLSQKGSKSTADKFYIIQILKSDAQNLFWVFTRTGRTGTDGKTQTHGPFGQAHLAAAQFEKRFRDKTKLAWKDRWAPSPSGDVFTVTEPAKRDEDDLDDMEFDEAALKELDALEQVGSAVQSTSAPSSQSKPHHSEPVDRAAGDGDVPPAHTREAEEERDPPAKRIKTDHEDAAALEKPSGDIVYLDGREGGEQPEQGAAGEIEEAESAGDLPPAL